MTTSYTRRARPTTYKGINMRSRLEAAYAQHLDAFHESWEYEGRAFANESGQYLPDFTFPDMPHMFHEIKPTRAMAYEALDDMHVILDTEPDASLVALYPHGDYINGNPEWFAADRCMPLQGCGRDICTRPVPRRAIQAPIRFSDYGSVYCPACAPGMYSTPTHLYDYDAYLGGTDGHRPAITLYFVCEYEHHYFAISLINHEGDTMPSYRILNENEVDLEADSTWPQEQTNKFADRRRQPDAEDPIYG